MRSHLLFPVYRNGKRQNISELLFLLLLRFLSYSVILLLTTQKRWKSYSSCNVSISRCDYAAFA